MTKKSEELEESISILLNEEDIKDSVKSEGSEWLLLVVAITTLSGFKFFHLDGSVLITLLATTTVNILGLAYIILRGLFLPIKNL
jgi:hypothetical protein